MSSISLNSIAWHGLPILELRIEEKGISLFVTPYNELTGLYDLRVLRITNAESLSFSFLGSLSLKDLSALEVSTFSYLIDESGRITGTLGLLPGQAGFWELSFTNAYYEFANA